MLKLRKYQLLLFASILLVIFMSSCSEGYRYVAYYTAWSIYGRNFQVANIPCEKISHLNYAFANLDASGNVIIGDPFADIDKAFPGDTWDETKQKYRGNFWQLKTSLKKRCPKTQILISIGGWTWSKEFSNAAATAAAREQFSKTAIEFITKYEFDGIDIDWEYPVEGGLATNVYRPEDGANYVLLLKKVREDLNKLSGRKRLLTIAAPAGPQTYRHLRLKEMAQYLDFINVMTYDYRGGWSKYTGHQTPLYATPKSALAADDPDAVLGDTEAAIQYYLDKGVPSRKLVVGAAIYGRGWAGVPNTNNGLYQKYTSVPRGTWDDWQSGNTGVFDYKDIKNKIASGEYKRFWDSKVKAPWVYSSASGMMISYDDPESIKEKIKFVKQKQLGGVMTWELSGDANAELTTSIYDGLFGSLGLPEPGSENYDDSNSSEGDTNSEKGKIAGNVVAVIVIALILLAGSALLILRSRKSELVQTPYERVHGPSSNNESAPKYGWLQSSTSVNSKK